MNGALDFLDDRPNVEPGRIGGLGLSTGADVLIEVAGENRRLSAVVAVGATGRSVADVPPDSLDVRPVHSHWPFLLSQCCTPAVGTSLGCTRPSPGTGCAPTWPDVAVAESACRPGKGPCAPMTP